MANITETAYPRLRSYITEDELYKIYTHSDEEIKLANSNTNGDLSKICFLATLKCFQRLGYFINITAIPQVIIKHITTYCNAIFNDSILKNYNKSSSKKRHLVIIREYLKITSYGEKTRNLIIKVATEASKTKDNDADIINIILEELIKHRYELPAFSTLVRISRNTRHNVYKSYYKYIYENLSQETIKKIDTFFNVEDKDTYSFWSLLKKETGKPTNKNLKQIILYYQSIKAFKINLSILSIIPDIKVKHFASEAKTLNSAQMKRLEPYKRYTLAICFLKHKLSSILDDFGEMFIKFIKSSQNKAKDKLDEYKLHNSQVTDNLISKLRKILIAYNSKETSDEKIQAIESVMGNKDIDEIIEECDNHNAYSGNNYFHFSWTCLKGKRSILFKLLDSIELYSTTQNKTIEIALEIIKKYKNSNKLDYIPLVKDEVDLSWVTDNWWKLLTGHTTRKIYPAKIDRRHFEACLFYQIMYDLKSGDLCIKHSDVYSDYREQLITWEEYKENISLFGEQVNIPIEGKHFIEFAKEKLLQTASNADKSFIDNQYLRIEKGEPILSKIKRKKDPEILKQIESLLADTLQPVNILDILSDTEQWLNWTKYFGPISGLDSKIDNPIERYIITSFCYGCNLGPTQTSRSLEDINRKQVAWINQKHITEEKLDKANNRIINAYNCFSLPKYWGTGERASADGTKWDLYEKNLVSEYHIRYGGYGGIGYYHVSDLYIALFSNFIPCGVWEGVYILDENIKNESDIRPNTYHADTQGQNTSIFGLSFLLGIKLMPRIRNWKDLTFFKADKTYIYEHIDDIFSNEIDWNLIETYLPDMLRVTLSIKMGKITPSTILKKLSSYSKKNKLYQAFRELGRVERTCFLLQYISDVDLRSTIQKSTNKSEAFNGFTKWLFFGGEGVIAENDRSEQRKVVKYNHLIANCVIFYNVYNMSIAIQELIKKGYLIDSDILSLLSPYINQHINRFGRYSLDKGRATPKLDFNISLL
ncbi:Tn3 family transposase [Inediibacterium massiliense]|uniref:Tn3 family transposase n=1 Tax=Inediibacterium massiliense TaxID=1658111 RepID=UPI0006B57881|nr:Tn3 family transposase [Inediibacterium massiliense]